MPRDHYWIPEELPLPRNTRTLFWNRAALDHPIAWIINRIDDIRKPGLSPWSISDQDLEMLLTVMTRGFEPPHWAGRKSGTGKKRRPGGASWMYRSFFTHLERKVFEDRIVIAAMPQFQSRSHVWGDPDANSRIFVVFARTPDGRWKLYPRSLRCRTWSATPSSILRTDSLARLAPKWEAAIHGLPRYAITREDRLAGYPVLFGVLSKDDTTCSDTCSVEEGDPFLQKSGAAIRALLAAAGIDLPKPDKKTFRDRFTCSLFARLTHTSSGALLASPDLDIKLRWNGWDHLDMDENGPVTPPEYGTKLGPLSGIAASLLLEMGRDEDPWVFDRFRYEWEDRPHVQIDRNVSSYFPVNWAPETFPNTSTAHTLMLCFSRLPENWKRAIRKRLPEIRAL